MANKQIDVVVVGSVALDTIETPFGRLEEGLGGSATYFSLSASHFCGVGLVGIVGTDFPEEHVALLDERGVDLAGFTRVEGETFRWEGEYGYDLNTAKTLDTRLNVFASFEPELPAAYRNAPFVFLGNIDPELQSSVLDQVEAPRFVACDTMNFWIQGKRDALLATLARVDAILLNDAEARELSGQPNMVKAIQTIHGMGPRVVVVKRGEYGALLSTVDGFFFAPAFPLEQVMDPTGAGDTFAGGFMGYLAARGTIDHIGLRHAVIHGSAMASFDVEDFGPNRFGRLSALEINRRIAAFHRLMDREPDDALP